MLQADCDKMLGESSCLSLGETLGEGFSERLLKRPSERFGEMLCHELSHLLHYHLIHYQQTSRKSQQMNSVTNAEIKSSA